MIFGFKTYCFNQVADCLGHSRCLATLPPRAPTVVATTAAVVAATDTATKVAPAPAPAPIPGTAAATAAGATRAAVTDTARTDPEIDTASAVAAMTSTSAAAVM